MDSDLDHDPIAGHGDREISLGAGTILGIFFALALVCGAVFGLGYSMGRHSAQNSAAAVVIGGSTPGVIASGTKPPAGSAAAPSVRALPVDDPPPIQVSTRSNVAPSDGMIAGDKLPRVAGTVGSQPVGAAQTSSTGPGTPVGTFMVQVAAVSTQEIADIELAALKKYNYPVVVRHEPTDQLLHIQMGPYPTRKDAEAMRQNVLSHGFNAIVK